ncbi:hypothetical protein OGATHE_004488 [Ogataea polymorpha]|uniref:Uncharacterized protein n=1 Tax=Ogataea polymorpha TaxID=460523 RepID=A0A9P8P0E1_9ASCO|nr:hypothetical protein OGATHE_004488 [Ogataea polymorpha]
MFSIPPPHPGRSNFLSTFCQASAIAVVLESIHTALLTSASSDSGVWVGFCKQVAMYLPNLGSHLTIWLPGSKQAAVISATELASCVILDLDMTGA